MKKLPSSKLRAGFVPLLLLLGIVAVLLLLGLTVFGPWELPGLGQLSLRQQAQKSEAALPDSDGDGFSDEIETYLGTDPARDCPTTESPNDENVDAWPPDFNDNRTIAIDDTNAVTSRFNKKAVGEHRRYDLNGDGWIRVDDIYKVSSLFNQKCTYYPYKLTATPSVQEVKLNWTPGLQLISKNVYTQIYYEDMTQAKTTECSNTNPALTGSNAGTLIESDFGIKNSPPLQEGQTSYIWNSNTSNYAPIPGHTYCIFISQSNEQRTASNVVSNFLQVKTELFKLSATPNTTGSAVLLNWTPAISSVIPSISLYGKDLTAANQTSCSSPGDFVGGFALTYNLSVGSNSYTWDGTSGSKISPGHNYCFYLFREGGESVSNYVQTTIPSFPSPSSFSPAPINTINP